ncbi:MAG: hprA [Planctomycetaceae bacterium]|nr:hprA [Planctomycetaceae bacterium]
MPRPLIVIPGDEPIQLAGSPHLERLSEVGDFVLYEDRPADNAEKIRRMQDAEVLINSRGSVRWPGEVLRELPRLKLISLCGIGADCIDLPAAKECGIIVSNIPGRTAGLVSEHALALLFGIARKLAQHTAELKSNQWIRRDLVYLRGKTLGVIGTGAIGREMIRLAQAVGMQVIAWSFHPQPEIAAERGFKYVELDELLQQADAISLHVKLTNDSRGLIGRREFGLMKSGSLLVNTARGAIIDTSALIEALHSGHLGGAGLDVFESEPIPADHPLLKCEQIILTPHVADQTPEGMEILNGGAVDNVIAYLQGKPQNIVTG